MNICLNRLKNRVRHEFDLEVVTPLFLGGADGRGAELRTASIKGMLRFWWRAVWGAECASAQELAEKEAIVWGNTERKASVSLHEVAKDVIIKKGPIGDNMNDPLSYFAYGQTGKDEQKNKFVRDYIDVGSSFSLEFVLSDKDLADQILGSAAVWIRHGGLGLRSRNGFGSLHCPEIIQFYPEQKIAELRKSGKIAKNLVFSRTTSEYEHKKNFPSAQDAMRNMAEAYKGTKGQIKQEKGVNLFPGTRYSKPLHFHVDRISDNTYAWRCLLLEPDDARVAADWKRFFDMMTKKVTP